MRIFLDTNVLAGAFLARGLCAELYESVALDHCLIVGEPVVAELVRILRDKLHVPGDRIAALQSELSRFETAPPSNARIDFPPDPSDVPILGCALAAGSETFVTGDKAILALNALNTMRIRSPRQLWLELAGFEDRG